MKFYESISSYYDQIFPITTDKFNFIKQFMKEPSQRVLDVACSTGEYTLKLAEIGHDAFGIDLDSNMIEKAKQKALFHHSHATFQIGNMLDLTKIYSIPFQFIFCIGNSLVHLTHLHEIKQFLKDSFALLETGGSLLIQIINFDRIIEKGITSLPTIKNDSAHLSFERNYVIHENENTIDFNTKLTVNNQIIENSVSLLPLKKDELDTLLKEIGFHHITYYGDFKGSPYDNSNSYALIMSAKK